MTCNISQKIHRNVEYVIVKADVIKIIEADGCVYHKIPTDTVMSNMAEFFAANYGNSTLPKTPSKKYWRNRYIRAITYLNKRSTTRTRTYQYKSTVPNPQDTIYYGSWNSHPFVVRDLFDITLSSTTREKVLVSGGYFLLDPNEDDTRYTAIGDVFGLLIADDLVISVPTVRRPALLVFEDGRTVIHDVDHKCFEYTTKKGVIRGIEVFCRENRRQDKLAPHLSAGQMDVVIASGRILDTRYSGRTEIPINGIVIRCSSSEIFDVSIGERVRVSLKNDSSKIRFGLQAGPSLIQNGEICFTPEILGEQNYVFHGDDNHLVPIKYPESLVSGCPKPKVGLGRNRSGAWFWLAAKPRRSATVSGFDLARELAGHGVENAVVLDGGGSARAYHDGKRVFGSADEKRSLPYFLEVS